MYIRTVAFEVIPEGKDIFLAKMKKDTASMKTFAGCHSAEAWFSESKDRLVFQLVSKWTEKKALIPFALVDRFLVQYLSFLFYRSLVQGSSLLIF